MSALTDLLKKEYERMDKVRLEHNAELQDLPHGYLSMKKIGKKKYAYLQYRDKGKVVSKYVEAEKVPQVRDGIEKRRSLEQVIRQIIKDQRKIKKIIGQTT